MPSRRYIAVVLSVAAVAAAGCGSSSSSKSRPAAPVTPSTPSTASTGTTTTATGANSAFVAQVKPICKQFQTAGKAAGNDLAKVAAVVEQFVPKFHAVTPPAELQSAYTQLLANFTKVADALKKKDLTTVQQLSTVDRKLATQLGLRHCAS